jgi:hypothetical protein
MTRKGSISIILVIVGVAAALAAAPATALNSSGSVTALSSGFDGDEQASSPLRPYPGSVTALAGGHDGTEQVSSQQPASPRSDYQPLNGILGEDGVPQPSSQPTSPQSDFQPLNGIMGEDGVPQPVPASNASDGDGFDWTDALIGALISSAVLAMAFIMARSVSRRRRATAESRA